MKKVLSIVLSIAMVLCMMPAMAFAGTATASQAAASYSDTVGTPCEGAVNVLHALGVVDGYTDGTYKPEQVVTRAEMAKLIVTALGLADYASATTSKFTDMGAASWAIPYVEYASNLNIVNGYGYGLFGPNDTVTYEQAVTMIVRALGYTDDCNEMNGSWPAIYVQKATALGLFDNVVNGGSAGADRGDVAIMLYNALEQYEVYADKDGATQYKIGDATTVINGQTVSRATMMSTLIGKKGTTTYKVVSDNDVENALINIRDYLGAAGKVTYKDGDAIAVGDLKSAFISGDLTTDGKLDVDGTKYTINDESGAYFDANGNVVTTSASVDSVALFRNGQASGTVSVSAIKSVAPYAASEAAVTLAADISGTTIKKLYSLQMWDAQVAQKVDDGDLAQITTNKKLLTVAFPKDDNGAIDTEAFILNGVDTLEDIQEDNVVAVYKKGVSGTTIARVDVGTEVVKGTVDKVSGSKITIDGKTYKRSTLPNAPTGDTFSAGDAVTIWLDYDGKWFDLEVDEATSGDYALLVSAGSTVPSGSATTSDTKVQLYTPSELTVYNVNGKKYVDNVSSSKFSDWGEITAAAVTCSAVTDSALFRIVKYALSDGKVSKIQNITDAAVLDSNLSATNCSVAAFGTNVAKITKTGYLSVTNGNTYKLANNVVIWSAPLVNTNEWDFSDTDDLSVVDKNDILDSDINAVQAIYNTKKEVVAMLIDDGSATKKESFGIATGLPMVNDNGSAAQGVNFYIGETQYSAELLDGNPPTTISNTTTTSAVNAGVLYKINKTTAGKYKFESLGSNEAVEVTLAGITTDGGVFTGNADKIKSVSGDKLTTSNGAVYYLSSDLIIYTYDVSDDETTVSTYSNRASLQSDDVYAAWLYKCKDDDSDAYNLINYIVVYQK